MPSVFLSTSHCLSGAGGTTGTTSSGGQREPGDPTTTPAAPGGVDPFSNMMAQMMTMMSQGNNVSTDQLSLPLYTYNQ